MKKGNRAYGNDVTAHIDTHITDGQSAYICLYYIYIYLFSLWGFSHLGSTAPCWPWWAPKTSRQYANSVNDLVSFHLALCVCVHRQQLTGESEWRETERHTRAWKKPRKFTKTKSRIKGTASGKSRVSLSISRFVPLALAFSHYRQAARARIYLGQKCVRRVSGRQYIYLYRERIREKEKRRA